MSTASLPPFYNMTQHQRDVMNFVVLAIRQTGQSPTVQEIADGTGRFASNVHKTLDRLEARGFIHREDNTPRGITLTAKAQEEASK